MPASGTCRGRLPMEHPRLALTSLRWSAPALLSMTDTPLVGEVPNREKMLRPVIMIPPILWLLSDEAGVNGKRFIAADWDTALPAAQAAEKAGAPIAWLSIARMPIEPT